MLIVTLRFVIQINPVYVMRAPFCTSHRQLTDVGITVFRKATQAPLIKTECKDTSNIILTKQKTKYSWIFLPHEKIRIILIQRIRVSVRSGPKEIMFIGVPNSSSRYLI